MLSWLPLRDLTTLCRSPSWRQDLLQPSYIYLSLTAVSGVVWKARRLTVIELGFPLFLAIGERRKQFLGTKKRTVSVPFSSPCTPCHYAVTLLPFAPQTPFPFSRLLLLKCFWHCALDRLCSENSDELEAAQKFISNSRVQKKQTLYLCIHVCLIQSISQMFHCVCLSYVLALSRSRGWIEQKWCGVVYLGALLWCLFTHQRHLSTSPCAVSGSPCMLASFLDAEMSHSSNGFLLLIRS